MKKMTIFEPALCCETGVCGVSIDSELLRISTILNSLKKHNVKNLNTNNNVIKQNESEIRYKSNGKKVKFQE